jgi:hypothetical protein
MAAPVEHGIRRRTVRQEATGRQTDARLKRMALERSYTNRMARNANSATVPTNRSCLTVASDQEPG